MKKLHNVQLEISLKPFRSADPGEVAAVTRNFIAMWGSLLRHADQLSILFWVGDGTELLEYNGNLDQKLSWAEWIGRASDVHKIPREKDPRGESLDGQGHAYTANPPVFTCGDLKSIVATVKRVAGEMTGLRVLAGTILEPGGELVKSKWKYERHPEVLFSGQGHMGYNIDCTSVLKADPTPYAGFPQGIPEGTPWGLFFGRQTRHFMADMGFDYFWMSNGYGIGRAPYAYGAQGQFFDGSEFRPDGNLVVRDRILEFWKLFREECPDCPVRLRGSDYVLGMDWANHATPYREILDGRFKTVQPPNTPWPALTSNFGMAMAGYLGRMSVAQGDIPYRLYTSDPWWANSAWIDSFNHSPHDIYLNLSLSAMDEGGGVRAADSVDFLTIDTSWGDIPEWIPDEVIPHIKQAFRCQPDEAGPLVWVYPFDEYEEMTFKVTGRINRVFSEDLFLQEAINNLLPLNTVVSSRAFIANQGRKDARHRDRIFVSPVPPAGGRLEGALLDLIHGGGRVLLYGSLSGAGQALLSLLQLGNEDPLSGDFELEGVPESDSQPAGTDARILRHQPVVSAGGISEVCARTGKGGIVHTVTAGSEGKTRVVGRVCAMGTGGGIVGWTRGTSSVDVVSGALKFRSMTPFAEGRFFRSEKLPRLLLKYLGMDLCLEREYPEACARHLTVSRHRNGFRFTLFSEERQMKIGMRFPIGAPVLEGETFSFREGVAHYAFHRFLHAESRIFIRENEGGRISCQIVQPMSAKYRHRVNLKPLKNATVCFFPPDGNPDAAQILLNPDTRLLTIGEPFDSRVVESGQGRWIEIRNVTGLLSFAW